jgi:hypothetical protein
MSNIRWNIRLHHLWSVNAHSREFAMSRKHWKTIMKGLCFPIWSRATDPWTPVSSVASSPHRLCRSRRPLLSEVVHTPCSYPCWGWKCLCYTGSRAGPTRRPAVVTMGVSGERSAAGTGRAGRPPLTGESSSSNTTPLSTTLQVTASYL